MKKLRPGENIVDALADPRRRGPTLLALLVAYAAVWTLYGIVTKACYDIQVDAAELVIWSHHPLLGYTKHPPLAPWLAHLWFMIFPVRDWADYLLAMVYAAATLWMAWRLFGDLLTAQKRIVALLCLTLLPYFNFFALRFDHNAALGLLWTATTLCFIRSFNTRAPLWAALAGVAAAAAMLGKYWSIFLLAGLAIATLADRRRAAYFSSPAPWITAVVGALVLAPHLVWLAQNDFSPFGYAIDAHETKTLASSLATVGRYLGGAVGYSAVPTLAMLALTRPSLAAVADTLWPSTPERRFIGIAFWVTLLLPCVFAPLFRFDLNPIWTLPALIVLPALLLSSPQVEPRPPATAALASFAMMFPLIMLAASPVIALKTFLGGLDPVAAHAKLLAARVEDAWKANIDRPLRIVGGEFGLANAVVFYLPPQVSAYPALEPETAPWVTPAAIVRDGAAMVCQLVVGEHDCTFLIKQAVEKQIAGNPPPRKVEVTLTRTFWGLTGAPQLYLIIIVPPK